MVNLCCWLHGLVYKNLRHKKCLMELTFDGFFLSANIIAAFGLKVKNVSLYFMNAHGIPYAIFMELSN